MSILYKRQICNMKIKKSVHLRKWILSILGILIIIISFQISQSVANKKPKLPNEKKDLIKEVNVIKVKNGVYQVKIPLNGVLKAFRRIRITARVQGLVKTIKPLFKAGQKYKSGQILISIDDSDYNANVISQRAYLYNLITSALPDLELDFSEDYKKWNLFMTGFDIEKPTPFLPKMNEKTRLFISGRGIISAYYSLQNLEQNLLFYQIKAPFDGVLVSSNVTEGSLIRSGQELGEFIAPDNYELKIAVPKSDINKIEEGGAVELRSIDNNQLYKGTIARINAKVNAQTQSIDAFIKVVSSDLKEGMFLEADINSVLFDNVLAIDRSLLIGGKQLFVVEDNKVRLKKADVIHFTENLAIIKGLRNGELIIDHPIIRIYDGEDVIPIIL